MKFGSQEWIEKLEDMVSFPTTFAFYYSKKDDYIFVNKVHTKGKPENIKFEKLDLTNQPVLMPKPLALVDVKTINTAQEYYTECKKIAEQWDVDMDKK